MMMYNNLVETLFFNPLHIGFMSLAQQGVLGVSVSQNGSMVDFYLQHSSEGLILKTCFKAKGCPYLIASMGLLCSYLEGKTVDEAQFDYQTLVRQLEMPVSEYPLALIVDTVYRKGLSKLKDELVRNEHECSDATY